MQQEQSDVGVDVDVAPDDHTGDDASGLEHVRSLSDLFALLPSPAPVMRTPRGESDWKAHVVADLLSNDDDPQELKYSEESAIACPAIPALQTRLHPYQCKTVACMLQREADSDGGGSDDGNTTSYSPVHGGILCEEMGTGKTLECLALILATCGSMPQAPRDAGAVQYPRSGDARTTVGIRTPSLATLCVQAIRSSTYPIQWHNEPALQHHTALRTQLQNTTPYYTKGAADFSRRSTFSRSIEDISTSQEARAYLSPATLIVVPATLITHWLDEITKHIHPPVSDHLRVLVVQDAKSIPSVSDIATAWDVILLSYDLFSREADRRRARPTTGLRRACQCKYIGSSREIRCECTTPTLQETPLLSCRFKRLIVDEGNKLAGQSRLVDLASQLNAENRWIVSGTPTEALVGAGDDDWSAVEQAKGTGDRRGAMVTSQQQSRRLPWTKEERKDIDERLFKLVAEFLHAAPYYNTDLLNYGLSPTETSHKSWTHNIVKPLFPASNDAPPIPALRHLLTLLSSIMVRTRPSDVARDKPLPPLRRHYIALDLSTLERKTFNVIQALISANAILSEQSDEDYFFHPANRKWLLEIIGNLWSACFHFASPERIEHADEAIKLIRKKINSEGKWKGHQGLVDALDHLESAMYDQAWRRQGVDVEYVVRGLPVDVYRAWRRQGGEEQDQGDGGLHMGLLTASELFDLQSGLSTLLKERGRASADEEDLYEDLITLGEKRRREWWISQHESASKKRRPAVRPKGKRKGKSNHAAHQDVSSGPLTASSISTSSSHAHGSSPRNSTTQHQGNAPPSASTSTSTLLPTSYTLLDATIETSSSTKLSSLVSLLISTATPTPTLIFSSQPNTLFELSYLLDVLTPSYPTHLSHRIFSSGVAQKRLDEYISLFKSGSINLLLLKIDRGGRGLDLHRATRVVFLEPEMRGALERQAVKRAWRQGQRCEVHAYWIFVRGTFEEKMMERVKIRHGESDGAGDEGVISADADGAATSDETRRSEASSSSTTEASISCMLRDPVMREFVAHPRYVIKDRHRDHEDRSPFKHHQQQHKNTRTRTTTWDLALFAGHAGDTAVQAAEGALEITTKKSDSGGGIPTLRDRIRSRAWRSLDRAVPDGGGGGADDRDAGSSSPSSSSSSELGTPPLPPNDRRHQITSPATTSPDGDGDGTIRIKTEHQHHLDGNDERDTGSDSSGGMPPLTRPIKREPSPSPSYTWQDCTSTSTSIVDPDSKRVKFA